MNKNLAPVIALGVSAAALTGFASSAQAAPGVHYPNCDAAVAARVAPMAKGEPGYRKGLDRNHNNVACEDAHYPAGYVKKVATQPAPGKPTATTAPTKPAPTRPAPVVGTPSPATPKPATTPSGVPSKPAAPKPAPSSSTPAGPVVQTDLEGQGNAEGSLAVLAGLTLAAGAGAWGLRRRLEQH